MSGIAVRISVFGLVGGRYIEREYGWGIETQLEISTSYLGEFEGDMAAAPAHVNESAFGMAAGFDPFN